jgi:uncharacterized protein YneF (UPF0154 family)
MAIKVNRTTFGEKLTVLAIFLLFICFVGLQISQKPTEKQLNQSVLQGQHQSEANYWWNND